VLVNGTLNGHRAHETIGWTAIPTGQDRACRILRVWARSLRRGCNRRHHQLITKTPPAGRRGECRRLDGSYGTTKCGGREPAGRAAESLVRERLIPTTTANNRLSRKTHGSVRCSLHRGRSRSSSISTTRSCLPDVRTNPSSKPTGRNGDPGRFFDTGRGAPHLGGSYELGFAGRRRPSATAIPHELLLQDTPAAFQNLPDTHPMVCRSFAMRSVCQRRSTTRLVVRASTSTTGLPVPRGQKPDQLDANPSATSRPLSAMRRIAQHNRRFGRVPSHPPRARDSAPITAQDSVNPPPTDGSK